MHCSPTQIPMSALCAALIVLMITGCTTTAANDAQSGSELQVAQAPNPACASLNDEATQWPEVDDAEPVRVEAVGPIACVDGRVVAFDDLQELNSFVVPYSSLRFVVEKLADARVNRYLVDRALEQAGPSAEVSDEELAAESKRFRAGFEDEAAMDAFLAEVTAKPFDEWFERRLRIRKLIEHRTGEAPVVAREEARSVYESNEHEFAKPKHYELVRVFFPLPEHATDAQIADVEQRAQRLADAAREDDADLLALGNEATELGTQELKEPMESLAVTLAEAVQQAERGDIVGPLESDYGYYVMRLDRVHPAQTLPFEDVADQLIGRLSRAEYKLAVSELRKTLRAEAEIVMLWGNLTLEVAE